MQYRELLPTERLFFLYSSIANLPSLPPIRFPERLPQMMINGLRNATQIIRTSLLSPAGSTVAVFAAPLVPLMAMGGPASLAGMHHSMHMGFNGRRNYRKYVTKYMTLN